MMVLRQKKFVLGGAILVVFLALVAFGITRCSGGNKTTASGSENQELRSTSTQTPTVAINPTPTPDSQKVVLKDRTLTIQKVTQQAEVGSGSTVVSLFLTIQNTSSNAIMNQLAFFQLAGPQGDIFGYQYNSSDDFYGSIAAHTTRTGTIIFQVPSTAMTGLHLMYHPEIGTESAFVLLKIA